MKNSKEKKQNNSTSPLELKFHYQKTGNFKNFHVDGAQGGLTAKGYLQMNMYLERHPIPKTQNYDVSTGELILISTEGKEGVIREIECGLIMDYNTMLSIHKWIGGKIEEFDQKFLPKKELR